MTTAQSIFDQVIEHLFKQGIAAIDPSGHNCAYRTTTGLMCAVGCLLDDDTYEKRFEGYSISNLIDEFGEEDLPALITDNSGLLSELQAVHDNDMPRYLPTAETDLDDVKQYIRDMRKVAEGLATIATDHHLQFNQNLIPEQYRHVD